MAQYDGSIRIGTGIDTKGFDKDGKELEAKVKGLGKALSNSGEIELKVDASGTEIELEKVVDVIEKEEKRIEEIAQRAVERARAQSEIAVTPQVTEESRPFTPGYNQEAIKFIEEQGKELEKTDEHLNLLKIDVEEYSKELKELQKQGKYFRDEDYNEVYIAWKNATDAVKAYRAELDKQTESGKEKIAEQEAKAAERREAAQRKAEERAEKALQKENERIQKETEAEARRQEKIRAEAAEEEHLARIRENAVVGNQRIVEAVERIKQLEQEIADLKAADRTEGYVDYDSRIQELAELRQEVRDYNNGIEETKEKYSKLGQIAKSAFSKIGGMVKKAGSGIKSFGGMVKNAFSNLSKSAKKSSGLLGTLGTRFKSLAMSLLIFNQISKAFRAMSNAIKEGFKNLYNDTNMESFKNTVDSLKASLLTLKNAFAAAFKPLVEIAIPYIQKTIEYMTRLADAFGQLIAAITGQKKYTKAIKQTTAALKEEKKAAEGYLSPLDEINKYQTSKSADSDAGGGTTMFEEAPVDSKFLEMANKIKEVMSQLFQPLKTVWENQGHFVMDSWKYALEEIGMLATSVGKDFLAVWNQPETVSVLENILIIVGDIGVVVGNLATRFREAWEANDVGLHILENIRDIFGIIIEHIRNAADYTVEWSKNLDFSPLLESVNGLLEALEPLADNIGAGLEWFWNNVLLPIAGWTIEEAIPTFLDMLSAAISTLNSIIEAFEPLATWLWETFLQPLGQWAGDMVIAAMQTITDLLTKFSNWISENKGLVENFVIVIGSFFAAWEIVDLATTIYGIVAALATFVTTGGLAATAAGAFGAAIAFLTSPITIAVAIIGSLIAIGVLLYKNWDEISAKAKEVWEFVKQKFQEFGTWVQDVFETDWSKTFGFLGGIMNAFQDTVSGIWGAIKKIFGGFIDFIAGVFTGDWRRAWDGIVQIFSGVGDAIKGIVNGILGVIESLANGVIIDSHFHITA